jgi:hypothetical protein
MNDYRDDIKIFVQQVLGCGCPENVFEYIDCKSNIRLNGLTLKNRINIGNKLLIYIIEINNTHSLENILPFLVKNGKKERDNLKFNRLRIVILTENVNEIENTARGIFENIQKDEKVHLHVVDRKKYRYFKI